MSVFDFIKDIPLSAVLIEKLKMADAEVYRIKYEKVELEKEKAELLARIADLVKESAEAKTSKDKFVDEFGLKFIKLPDGSYDKTIPFCPRCEFALYEGSACNRRTHMCSNPKCGFISPLDVRSLYTRLKRGRDQVEPA